jgi:hypothetical protein
MLLVAVADGAVFAPFNPLRVLPLVLVSEEVAALALGAFEDDFVSRHFLCRTAGRPVGRSRIIDRLTA